MRPPFDLSQLSTQFSTELYPRGGAEPKEWTVMVYLAGDNNLSEHMAASLESLATFSASMSEVQRSKMNVLAYFDGSALTAPTMYVDLSEMEGGRSPFRRPVSSELQFHQPTRPDDPANEASEQSLLNENSASPEAMLNFVRWCTSSKAGCRGRKARNYALIVSGHSLGFHGKTFLHDESSGQHFTLHTFRDALEQINELYLNDSSDGRIAILGFDSCLMSMLEVGYELKDVTKTIVASQGSLPNAGWGYASMLSHLAAKLEKNAAVETSELAAGLVSSFTEHHRRLAIGGRSMDIAAWNLDKVGTLASAVDRLGNGLSNILRQTAQKDPQQLFHQARRIILQSHYDSQTYMADQCVDIKDLCQRLISECEHNDYGTVDPTMVELTGICAEVIAAVDECVLKCGFSGDTYQFSNGISMFFPWSSLAFALTDSQYRSLRFIKGDELHRDRGIGFGWYAFLLQYVGNVTVRRSRKPAKDRTAAISLYDSIDHGQNRSFAGATKDGLPYTKDGLPYTKDGLPYTKDGLPYTKDGLPYTKDGLPYTKGVSESSNYLAHFGRFKNFELGWNISGFADELSPEENKK